MSTIIPDDKHRDVLGVCVDVPEQPPSFPVELQKVGISGKTVWIRLAQNRGGHIPFTASIFVNLPADRRGIHMSRIEQVITDLHEKKFTCLSEYGKQFAHRVLKAQNAQHVSVELYGRLPFSQQAPVSRLVSIDTVEASLSVEIDKAREGTREKITMGAAVHHLTACPCTLSYNEVLFNRFSDPCPMATHSQRSITELSVSSQVYEKFPSHDELVAILAGVLHVSQDLLKRPDETELVLKAHRSPQFAEDTVREVAQAAGDALQERLPPETEIRIKTTSLESIHIHDVECCLQITLGEILAVPAAKQEERKR